MEKYINETLSMGRMIAVEHDGYGPPIDLSAQISQVDTMGVIFGIVANMPRVCTLYASSRFSAGRFVIVSAGGLPKTPASSLSISHIVIMVPK